MANRAVLALTLRPHFPPRGTRIFRPPLTTVRPVPLPPKSTFCTNLPKNSLIRSPHSHSCEKWLAVTQSCSKLIHGARRRHVPMVRKMSTFPSTEIQSTEKLNEYIEDWKLNEDISVQDFKKLLIWMDAAHSLLPDAVTFGLLLERALRLQLRNREADALVSFLLENLLDLVASNVVASGSTSLNLLPPEPIEWYMYLVLNRLVYEAQQTELAHEWLDRWWRYHELRPERIFPPTPKAYEMIMKGWTDEGESHLVLGLLQDMLSRENIKPQVQHFEMCLNALVRSATHSQRKTERNVAYDAEAVLLQMSEWLNSYGSELATEGEVDSTGRSSQTRALQNLTKVVQCWVDSRQKDAAARTTSILDLVDGIFRESKGTTADWAALSESYAHVIRAWSHAATAKSNSIRRALSQAMRNCDPTSQAGALLLRLEDWEDWAINASGGFQSVPIPVRTWRRVYGSAIAACGSEYDKSRLTENRLQAWKLWDKFVARGYGDLNTELYNHLFHVFGKMGDFESSDVLWKELRKHSNVAPDLKIFNGRLLAVKNSTSWSTEVERCDQAKVVWNQLRSHGFTPDTFSVNTFLSCLSRTNDLAVAKEGDAVFRDLLECRGDRTREASTISLNILLRMWSNFASHSKVSSERKEALRSVLHIVKEVYTLGSTGELKIRPTAVTTDRIIALLDANKIAENKRIGVLRLLENTHTGEPGPN